MQQCPKCSNTFDEWYAKDKGQKFPFKSCPSCRQKAREQREQQQFSEQSGQPSVEVQELKDIVFNLEKRMLAVEKSMGMTDLPKTVSEEEDIDVKDIPF